MTSRFPLIDPVKFGILLLGGAILFLAGFYLGSFFLFLFFFFMLLPILSFLQFVATAMGLRHYQDFSTSHPVKGQEVVYRLTLTNESPFPTSHVNIRFKAIQEEFRSNMMDFSLVMKGNETCESTHGIRCPFRGVYTVGLESLEIEDMFRIFTVRLPVWYRTFYVYPRIIELRSALREMHGNNPASSGSSHGTIQDYTLYESLSDYRPGDPIRHISWKKFASLGQPYLKTYEKSAQPGMTLYLDTRRQERASERVLTMEDCSVEIMVALVKAFTDRSIPVQVRVAGWHDFAFSGPGEALFERFHHATIMIEFGQVPSPRELFAIDVADNRIATRSIIVVTHLLDPETVSLASIGSEGELSATLIMNLSGLDETGREQARRTLSPIVERGGTVYRVESPDSIQDAIV